MFTLKECDYHIRNVPWCDVILLTKQMNAQCQKSSHKKRENTRRAKIAIHILIGAIQVFLASSKRVFFCQLFSQQLQLNITITVNGIVTSSTSPHINLRCHVVSDPLLVGPLDFVGIHKPVILGAHGDVPVLADIRRMLAVILDAPEAKIALAALCLRFGCSAHVLVKVVFLSGPLALSYAPPPPPPSPCVIEVDFDDPFWPFALSWWWWWWNCRRLACATYSVAHATPNATTKSIA